MSSYKISVITPLHNVKLNIFNHCYESMKAQTLGFENIEWIVVIHNSSEEYEKSIYSLLSKHSNVKLHTLHDEYISPSSPRNLGLDLVSTDFIGFLDADDKYTPKCLETALSNIIETDSDICVFRREVELETKSDLVLNEIVLWDQTQERIIVNKDNWDSEKLFTNIWGMITSKIYRKSLFDKYHLRFNHEISIGEDFALNAYAYSYARNICLLPQLIGYVYFVNKASLAQNMNISKERLIKYAKGFKTIFDIGLSNGLNLNDTMHHLLTHSVLLTLYGKEADESVKLKFREILEPYVRMLKPLKYTKLYPKERHEELSTFPYKILSFGTSDLSIKDYQLQTFKKVIVSGEYSDYGQRYSFKDVITTDNYTSSVMMSSYENYKPMIQLGIRINESGIFTNEDIISYTLDFDSKGNEKRMPLTASNLEFYVNEFNNTIKGDNVYLMYGSRPFLPSGLDLDNTYTNTLMGLILYQSQKENNSQNIANPKELLLPDEIVDAEYTRLLFALKNKDIDVIFAPNAWTLLNSFDLLFDKWEILCNDIEEGIISEAGKFSKEVKESLLKQIQPDHDRADELRTIFKSNNPEDVATQIWPNLKKIICDTSASYKIYADQLKNYLSDIEIENSFLATEEALIGKSNKTEGTFELNLNSAFYEFIPVNDEDKILLAHEIEENQIYRIIVSTTSGLYRYKTDLYIRVLKVNENSIIFEKLCDRVYDNVTEEEIYSAVKACSNKLNLAIKDFVYFTDENGENNLLLEPSNDINLKDINTENLSKIASDLLPVNVNVSFSIPYTHILYNNYLQNKHNIFSDAVRPTHMTNDENSIAFFKKYVY